MAVTPWLQQQQEMQALLGTVEQEQAGPAATAPSPQDVLEILNVASTLGFGIFSSIYGAVTAINPQTGQIDTASGTVAAAEAGTISTSPPAALGGGRAASTQFQVREPGSGWMSDEWINPTNIALVVGGVLLIALVTRR